MATSPPTTTPSGSFSQGRSSPRPSSTPPESFTRRRANSFLESFSDQIKMYNHSLEDRQLIATAMQKVAPLAQLPPTLHDLLVGAFERIDVPIGENVITAFEDVASFYIVGDGVFRLSSPQVNGGRSCLGEYRQGGVLCESVLFNERDALSPVSVRCAGGPAVLFTLQRATFKLVNEHLDDCVGFTGDPLEFVTDLPMCEGVPAHELRALVGQATATARHKGSHVLRPGDPHDGILIFNMVRAPFSFPIVLSLCASHPTAARRTCTCAHTHTHPHTY